MKMLYLRRHIPDRLDTLSLPDGQTYCASDRLRHEKTCRGSGSLENTMVSETCHLCQRILKTKALREQHVNCDGIRKQAGCIENRACTKCGKVLPRPWGTVRHMKGCQGGMSLVTSQRHSLERSCKFCTLTFDKVYTKEKHEETCYPGRV